MKDFEREEVERQAKAIAKFPFERIEVEGENALAAWEDLKTKNRGIPIVLGGDESVATMMDAFDDCEHSPWQRPVLEILDASAKIRFPEDLIAKRNEDRADATGSILELLSQPDDKLPKISEFLSPEGKVIGLEFGEPPEGAPNLFGSRKRLLSPDEVRAYYSQNYSGPKIGDWPDALPGPLAESACLTLAFDILTQDFLPKVHIALIPTNDWTEIPAYLRWGNWNENPKPEFHVAALRSWRDRFGAELVGMGFDTLNLRVSRGPGSREEALALAQEQYVYCNDIIDQGVRSYRALAAG